MSSSPANPVLHDLKPQDVQRKLEAGEAILIDVREPGEYEAQRIPGALLFPLSEFEGKYLPLEGARQVILHCGSGNRSRQAAQRLFKHGVVEAFHLAGGIKAWVQAGLPSISYDPDTGGWRRSDSNA